MSSSVSIPATAAVGGLSITMPATNAAATYYKIADNNFVTWGWNMTSVYNTPTSLTVAAIGKNGNTYTISTIPGTATNFVWSPYSIEQTNSVPWAVTSYTAKIWDDRGPTATAEGGKMSVNSGITFALYRPQTYTSLSNGWTCASCSSARELLSQPGFCMLFMTILTIFISGWGILGGVGRRTRV
ncbi:hypothetical protein [Phaffia rhodozyma]|uniref:DUF7137 domain-containing protein n=1 Tax=Phaffia rhodozyma TaxID=264483 RepID=A0A0F7SQQ0_PHARH|nr:hypothetical protein [Phaffia rhodozyma]